MPEHDCAESAEMLAKEVLAEDLRRATLALRGVEREVSLKVSSARGAADKERSGLPFLLPPFPVDDVPVSSTSSIPRRRHSSADEGGGGRSEGT